MELMLKKNKADIQRKEYNNFKLKDYSFGYSHNDNEYWLSSMPIIFEQNWFQQDEIDLSDSSYDKKSNSSDLNSSYSSITYEERHKAYASKPILKKCKHHVVFLVHGYQSNYSQMNYLLNAFSRRYPRIEVISCKSIENKEALGIFSLGKTLAKEIIEHIKSLEIIKEINWISMIGHSMGGLVIRASLGYLKEYKSKMNSLITLGTPHLGYLHSNSKIVSAGIWIAKKLSLNRTISEMSLSDSNKLSETVLYKLSTLKSIVWFKNVIVIGSAQDTYGPLESAIIHRSQRIQSHSNSKAIEKILNNLLENLSKTNFVRLRVNMKIADQSLDTYIGRTAHIQFIDNYLFAKMIIYRFHDLFDN